VFVLVVSVSAFPSFFDGMHMLDDMESSGSKQFGENVASSSKGGAFTEHVGKSAVTLTGAFPHEHLKKKDVHASAHGRTLSVQVSEKNKGKRWSKAETVMVPRPLIPSKLSETVKKGGKVTIVAPMSPAPPAAKGAAAASPTIQEEITSSSSSSSSPSSTKKQAAAGTKQAQKLAQGIMGGFARAEAGFMNEFSHGEKDMTRELSGLFGGQRAAKSKKPSKSKKAKSTKGKKKAKTAAPKKQGKLMTAADKAMKAAAGTKQAAAGTKQSQKMAAMKAQLDKQARQIAALKSAQHKAESAYNQMASRESLMESKMVAQKKKKNKKKKQQGVNHGGRVHVARGPAPVATFRSPFGT